MTGSALLSQYLASQKLSLRAFAAKVGTTASNVSQWTRERKPGVEFALAIERVTRGAVPLKSWRAEAR